MVLFFINNKIDYFDYDVIAKQCFQCKIFILLRKIPLSSPSKVKPRQSQPYTVSFRSDYWGSAALSEGPPALGKADKWGVPATISQERLPKSTD